MNKMRNLISALLGVLALAALAVGLAWLLGPQGVLPAQQVVPTQQVSPLRTPVLSETPMPTPIVIVWTADQTPTPWLTPTPLSQPTRRPGPTETPRPLVQPAQDAAGEIIYIDVISSREEARGSGGVILGKTLAMSALAVYQAGVARQTAARLTGAIEPNFEWRAVYPSPDGRRLAVEGDWGVVKILDFATGSLEWPALPAGGGGAGGFLGWHPDSRQILYRNDAGYDAGLVLVDTKQCILLVREDVAQAIRDATVSPDGQKVIYSFWRSGDTPAELRMVNVNGSDPRVLLTCGSDTGMISWSPDGSKIGFFGCGGYTIMNANGDVLGVLKLYAPEYPSEPLWSPDGRLLLYASTTRRKLDPYDPFRQAVVHVVDVATGKEILTLEEATDPAWSPDGSQIVFVSARSGIPQVWAINLDGTNLRQLTSGDQPARFPFWHRTQRP